MITFVIVSDKDKIGLIPKNTMSKKVVNYDVDEIILVMNLNVSQELTVRLYNIYQLDLDAKKKEIIKNYCK